MSVNVSMSTARSAAHRTLLALLTTSAIQLAAAAGSQASASPLPGHFSGGAQGIGVGVAVGGSPVLLLHVAAENCPCQGSNGITRTITMPTASIPNTLMASTNTATAVAAKSDGKATTNQTATVSALSLFDGAITADTITAAAGIVATQSNLATSSDGTSLVNLVIAGKPIAADVPANTTVALPGVGRIVVKYVKQTSTAQDAAITVNGLEVFVTEANKYGLSIGTRIKVGSASAGYSRVQPVAALAGDALTASVSGDTIAGVPANGKVGAAIGIADCTGTGGATNSKTTENLSIPGLATAAAGTVTAFAGPVGATITTKTTSVVTDVSLLGGVVTVQTLTAVAQEARTGVTSTASTAGSGFTGLKIVGLPVAPSTTPNLALTVPGFGVVTFNEQTSKPALGSVSVTALDLSIDRTNVLNIPVGTHLALGIANAIARKF